MRTKVKITGICPNCENRLKLYMQEIRGPFRRQLSLGEQLMRFLFAIILLVGIIEVSHFVGYKFGKEAQKGREIKELNAFLREQKYGYIIDDSDGILRIIRRSSKKNVVKTVATSSLTDTQSSASGGK